MGASTQLSRHLGKPAKASISSHLWRYIMPRLGNQLKDIETNIEPVPEAQYDGVLTVEDAVSKKGSPMVVFTFKLEGGDYNGREIQDFCTLVKKDGGVNVAGLRQIKRIAEPLVGERCNSDDFDTAELDQMPCTAFIKQEGYTADDGGERMGNRLARMIGPR